MWQLHFSEFCTRFWKYNAIHCICYILLRIGFYITVGLFHQIHFRFPNLNHLSSFWGSDKPWCNGNFNLLYSFNQWNHEIFGWSVVSFLPIDQNFHRTGIYSLISIRQNYHFDMFSMILHEIICWLLKIYQDLRWFAEKCFCIDICCVEQF